MTLPMIDLADALKARAVMTADDVLAIRRVAWPDGKIDAVEADAIFALNDAIAAPPAEWVAFFVEAITAYVVQQQAPTGYVDDAKAAWLMARIDADGRVESRAELETLVKILEVAVNVPDKLKAYALRQIEAVVTSGAGPTRSGTLDPGSINATEITLLRRMLFAAAGDGPGCISQGEAELLFRLKAATMGAANAPEWKTLFVQAVGNHLMAHSDYQPLSRDRAGELDAFMNDTRASVGGFLGRMGQSLANGVFLDLFGSKPAKPDHDAAVAADRAIAPGEAAWLKAQVDADGTLDDLEKALLAFVAEESGRPAF